MITVTINGDSESFDSPMNVTDLLTALSWDKSRLAVERNAEIVPRSRYDDVEIGDGDTLEIVHFIGGG